MDEEAEWTVNANEVVTLSLVNNNGCKLDFNPQFTYPIYGDSELIYGYRGLQVNVQFDASSLLPYVECKYDGKLPNAQIPGPLEKLMEFTDEEDTFTTEREWKEARQDARFQLPGEVVGQFAVGNENYKVFKSNPTQHHKLHLRMQLFVLFFIEAGSYIDTTDDRWELYMLYKTPDEGQPEFVGFSTVYSYFWYGDYSVHDAQDAPTAVRKRISQFVILPPFQGKRLGAALYSTLVDVFMADTDIKEITVEDPSEAFDDLRDRCDLERLAKLGVWDALKFPLDLKWMQVTRSQNKVAPRQFDRCVEMALLHKYQPGEPDKQYRVQVKRRLYQRNREVLNELDREHSIEKLHETYQRLIEDYARIIENVDFSPDKKGKGKKRLFAEVS
jgi:histone acetyltransferase 1